MTMDAPDRCEVLLTLSESNPICLLRGKISTNNYVLRKGQNLVALQIRDKIY